MYLLCAQSRFLSQLRVTSLIQPSADHLDAMLVGWRLASISHQIANFPDLAALHVQAK